VFAGSSLLLGPLPFMLPALARDVLDVGPRELSWFVSGAGLWPFQSGRDGIGLSPSAPTVGLGLIVAIAVGLCLAPPRSRPAHAAIAHRYRSVIQSRDFKLGGVGVKVAIKLGTSLRYLGGCTWEPRKRMTT
jgi:hypothetical protein